MDEAQGIITLQHSSQCLALPQFLSLPHAELGWHTSKVEYASSSWKILACCDDVDLLFVVLSAGLLQASLRGDSRTIFMLK